MTEENPFENIRPELRSEEDDIRRGVFSRALRNLAMSTSEQKRAWCAAVDEIYETQRARAHGKKKEALAPVAGQKREREGSNDPANEVGNQPQGSSDTPNAETGGSTGDSVVGSVNSDNTSNNNNTTTNYKNDDDDNVGEIKSEEPTTVEKEYLQSDSAANRYIGAFLHSQVEKAIGATLHSLSPSTLRFLCTVLGLTTRSRSKEALYNMLASFHYTHCEVLGKRVSRSTFVDQQAKQDSVLLSKLTKTKTTKTVKKDSAVPSPAPAPIPEKGTQKTIPKNGLGSSALINTSTSGGLPSARISSSGSVSALSRPKVATTNDESIPLYYDRDVSSSNGYSSAYSPPTIIRRREENNAEVMISYPTATFQTATTGRSTADHRAFSNTGSSVSVSTGVEEWSAQRIEKSIATIVRNYDPVTTSIVLKKLAKIGYSSPEAPQVVESCLQRFHQKKYIHYENGIAYCLD